MSNSDIKLDECSAFEEWLICEATMKLNLRELKIIEALLRKELTLGNECEIAELHEKVKKRISDVEYNIALLNGWMPGSGEQADEL